MLNSLPVRLLWHSLNWLTRLTIVASGLAAVLCAVIIVMLRYWLLPDIEQFHGRIASSLSSAMGNPVSIGRITGDWDGLHPHLNFSDVRILDSQGNPALVLPKIDASVSWLSLPAAQLRLSSLEIERPELLIRRDKAGKMYVGSVALANGASDNDLANWLLHQSRMVVRNAVIVWQDELRDAPPLVLDQVNLRIENMFSRHRFALRATPPLELATPLDVRGDFHGRRFDDLGKWRGQIYTQLDYTDLKAWRPWLKLPPQLSRGRGALRGWLGIADGKISQLTLDMALHDVTTRLAETVPEMDVNYLRGRASWKALENGWEVATKRLALRLHNGLQLQPTDFYLKTTEAAKSRPAGGELRANQLQLESLVSLASFLPLDQGLSSGLNAYAPRGHVSDLELSWRGAQDKLIGYQIKGRFDNLAVQQTATTPGFSGLSVTVDGTDAFGHLYINTRNLTVIAPEALREPLQFNTLTGQLEWRQERGELGIHADNISVANDDLAGNVNGSYQTKAGTRGILDMTIALTRGDIRRAARYTPLIALDRKQNDWLNDAMLSGHTEDFRLKIKGNLSDFPLNGTTDTLFEMSAHAEGVAVKFAPDWPKAENINGDLLMRGNKLEVKAPTAAMLGAQLHNLDIVLPDMRSPDMPLEIKGEADGANNAFLQFIQQSPVRGYINEFTDGMSASGNGRLDLYTRISLNGTKPVKVAGNFRVQGSDIDLGPGIPWLRNTGGELTFSESEMHASGVTADILGGPARLNVQTAEGGMVRANLQGRVNIDALRKTETSLLLNFLRGGTAWDANISVVKKTAQLTLNSSLQGIGSTLPAPLAKSAGEIWPLHIEKKNIADGQDVITAQLGKLLRARLFRAEDNGVAAVRRGVISFGAQEADKGDFRGGVWITGNLPALSLQGWDGLAGGSGPALPIAGANLHVDRLTGYGMSLNDLQISASRRGDGLAAQVTSAPANGEVIWQPHGYEGGGKLTAHLSNLYWQGEAATPQTSQVKPVAAATRPHDLPAMDISIEDLLYKGKQIGRLELVGTPDGQDWRLRRLHVANPDGTLSGDGLWRNSQTQINLLLEITNAGKILARSDYPNTVKNGSGKLAANLSWNGQPDEFNYATLDGTLKLDTGKGQFLKMENLKVNSGAEKMLSLLSIMSLQALPKRIALDFTDVFSSGFEFDNINGNATISRGVMQTQDLHMDGSSAKVTMSGTVNLNDETQNIHLVILPTLGSSVSMLSAFAAGPVVGLGTLIVSKVLGNPLDKLMSFEYNVSGTWSDPVAVKVGQTPVKIQNAPKNQN